MSMRRSQLVLSVVMFWLTASLCLTNCSSSSSNGNFVTNDAPGDVNYSNSLYGNYNSLVGQTLSSTGNASFTATSNGNFSFAVESAVFDAYSSALDGNVGAVFAFFSSSPNLCLDFNLSSKTIINGNQPNSTVTHYAPSLTVTPNSTLTVLWMQNYNTTTSLYGDSSVGNFTIGGNTGNQAFVYVYHFDANCAVNTNVMAMAGTIDLSTLMMGSNANLTGTITDAYLGATNGNLNGSFTATPCGSLAYSYDPNASQFTCTNH